MTSTTTTLAAEIAACLASARREGYTGFDREYELTVADCESIVDALGRKPSLDEWADAGYPTVGSAHVSDE